MQDDSRVFEKLYETQSLINVVPVALAKDGLLWVDKRDGKGYTVPFERDVTKEYKKALEGKTIMDIASSNPTELISFLSPFILHITISNKQDINYFDESLRNVADKLDEEGNPVILIYWI